MAIIGELKNIPTETNSLQTGHEIEWKISSFDQLASENDNYYFSPSFCFADETWHLKIYPNGIKVTQTVGCIGLYLILKNKSSGSPVNLEYTLGLKTLNGGKDSEHHRRYIFYNADKGYGVHCCLARSELYERASDLLPSGTLTVFFLLKDPKPVELPSKGCISISSKVLKDLKELFQNKKYCDVVIKIKEQEFPAHRNILAARSPVFESTFQNDMKEKATGIIDIKDCDPCIFSDFLFFLYCGDSQIISEKNVFNLFITADRYNVEDLKVQCIEFMTENLSIDTFCDAFSLALQYSENELLQRATDFFADNLQNIIVTEEWESLLGENPKQSNKLLIHALVTNKS